VLLALALLLLAACSAGDEHAQWLSVAKKIAEDKMNPHSDFVARQLAQGKKPNRLINEKSPYLLQHAFNPVDWYPWGDEAFAKARAENKPIFLSVGYSTCHWCHVMAHESFENPDIAKIMNTYFVCIKVDREERPDVDRVYMAAVQALTGQGGWPMSVFLTPGLQPFYGGTYFPPESKFGRPGFRDLLLKINDVWNQQHEKVVQSAAQITEHLQNAFASAPKDTGALGEDLLDAAFRDFHASYDSRHGGFSGAPKFPRPSTFNFLFHYHKRAGSPEALEMALRTLREIAAGGIYDHLGGGFHRYSVDAVWRVPHFEKMLYDQAQLCNSYLDAFQLTGEDDLAQVVRETLTYVQRDMTAPEGGFYSAEDADSAPDPAKPDHKKEGAFYLWTTAELQRILGKKDAAVFAFVYGATDSGNTLSDPQNEFGNGNVLYAAHKPAEAAQKFGKPVAEIAEILAHSKETLLTTRNQRRRPGLDDKIITAWNGLMISAFARAAAILEEASYLASAKRAADFILQNLRDPQTNTLHRRYRDGEARYPGHLDDYAFLIHGLLDLYEARAGIRYLQAAETLAQTMLRQFRDDRDGTFFDSAPDAGELLFRSKEFYDGAEPAGNSMAILALLRLGRMLDRSDFIDAAETALRAGVPVIRRSPSAYPQLLVAVDFALAKPMQIVIAGDPAAAATGDLLRQVHRRYLPNRVLLFADAGAGQAWLGKKMAFIRDMQPLNGRPVAYVCENFVCELPTADAEALAGLLK